MNLRRLCVSLAIGAAATVCFAQPNRILSKIDNARTVTLPGRVHPLATAGNDAGAVDPSFPVPFITLLLKPAAAQQASLDQLLQDQQNPASSSYHRWLTPEQYADRFGISPGDAAQIVAWLQSQGFKVNPVSRSRTFITFDGAAGQVQAAFGTAIHHYQAEGRLHYANATDPKVPAALSSVVAGFRGLTDFHFKSRLVKAKPLWTQGPGEHVLAPDDFATIYDVTAMYSAGINGSGVKIAIPGQSQLYNSGSDTTSFWSTYGISATLVQTLVPTSPNPGLSPVGDLDESSLDTQWAGAVARGATIEFVYSNDVFSSAQYAVDQALAPVLSISYGVCEMSALADLASLRHTVQQANAEGMTWLASAGDSGAAECDNGNAVAERGLAVYVPASVPEVTSMGGTTLNNGAAYWNTGNTSTNESAKAYSAGEETAWNDTAANVAGGGGLWATGGGASMYFPQPSWQTGIVPNNGGWRNLPDLSLSAGGGGVPYVIYCGSPKYCVGGETGGTEYATGTSATAPAMAGVVALLNQYLKTNGLGNINPTIYQLSQTSPSAFHDITTGNNIVPCAQGSPGCNGGEEGYSATVGYDSATGIGSVDVTNLIQQWSTAAPAGPLVVPSIDQNPVYKGFSESCGTASSWNFRLTVSEEAGIATTLTGFSINGADYSSKIASIFGSSAIGARQSISGCVSLASVSVPENETFTFSGPGWSTSLTISFQGSLTQLSVGGASNAASGQQVFAPGMIMSVYGAGMGSLSQSASTIPLPEYMAGINAEICPGNCNTSAEAYPAPLYYVGPNQVNLQIPYEVSGAADLKMVNPYYPTGVDYFFTVSPAAPGIFALEDGSQNVVPLQTVSAGGVATVYLTGAGQVTPSVADGSAPTAAPLPKPQQAVTVTVGGIAAATIFVGIPTWSVGVVQINFTVPAGVPSGRQPVVVTVGTAASPAAYITIQ